MNADEVNKLFVWEGRGTLQDYSSGMICVLAPNLETALVLIKEKMSYAIGNFDPTAYKVITKPEAFCCYGGG